MNRTVTRIVRRTNFISRVEWFMSSVALVLVMTACDDGSMTLSTVVHNGVRLTKADAGKTVVVPAGGSIEITLQSIGPGQYGTPQLSSDVVTFDSMNFTSEPNPAGVKQIFSFHCLTKGSVLATIPHTGGFPGQDISFEVTLQCT